jgi:hypothetical protein
MFWPSYHIIHTHCDPGCSYSNSLFSVSSCHLLCHLPICSFVSLVVMLPAVSTYILFFTIIPSDIWWNDQTSLIFVLLCDLLYSYVLLIHCLFWFSMYHLFLL